MALTESPTALAAPAEHESADKLFWLSRLEGDLPKASVVPDFRRTAGGQRSYRSVAFELAPDVVRALKSPDLTQGVSDAVLCTSLVAVLLAQYHREDELVLGLQLTGGGESDVLVPFRIPTSREASVIAVMRAVAEELAQVRGRALSGLADVTRLLQTDARDTRYPFFDVGIGIGGTDADFDFAAYPIDLLFAFEATGGRIRGRVLYASDLYEEGSVRRIVSHFLRAAEQASAHPQRALADVRIVSPDELHQLLDGFRGPRRDFPLGRTLHSLFEDQVRRTPNATAVVHRSERLSYAALNEQANRIAHTLLSLGLAKGSFVGILLERGPGFLAAMLGVFKAGGAYVPLDPTYPRDRVRYMLDDSEARFVVSRAEEIEAFAEVLSEAKDLGVILTLEGAFERTALAAAGARADIVGPDRIGSAPAHDPALPLDGADRAYMIYTSGSSGRPKGAICRHDGAINHLYGELDGIGVAAPFSFLQTAASSSDISVWQFMAPVLFGGATVVADYDAVVDPAQLFALLREHRVNVAEPVPVVLRALLDHVSGLPARDRALPDLRCMMCTGEALASELVDRWLALYPGIPVGNTYGPTETSDDVTLHVMRQPIGDRRAIAPIGRALPNVDLYIVDRDLRPVPIGVPGEICVGGIAVGEGYWRQPDKTRDAFVRWTVPGTAEGLVYRTGDLGRWLDDGAVEFLGRIDQQVKIRGFRVEPGEIEGVLTQHPAIQDAAVVATADGAGNKRLVAYYVTHKARALGAAELRQYLKGALAEHMIPALLVAVGALPLTPLGKVDRRALSRMESEQDAETDEFVAPRTAAEAAVAQAWSKVLGRQKIGALDNFFEIGGDSISTLQVVAELRKAGFRLAPKQLFLYPTVAELAAHAATQRDKQGPAPEPAAASARPEWAALREQLAPAFPGLEDAYPLSATQRGIYFQSILAARTSGAYIEQLAFELDGALDEDAFWRAWQHVVNTTDVLRTAIVRRGTPQPAQVVLEHATLVPEKLDWRSLPADEQPGELGKLLDSERARGFDLKAPPLFRVSLARLAERRYHVVWTYHHIILDGWSEPLVLRAVFDAYHALVGKREPPSAPAARYRDFVAWAETRDLAAAEAYWREQLAGFAEPVSIKDQSPAIQPPSNRETTHGSQERTLSEPETRRLEDFARRTHLTTSTLVHGAWSVLLHARTGAGDAVLGSVVSGRQCDAPGADAIRGILVVTQPLRTRLAAEATAISWLRLLQVQMAEMREHEHTPLALIQQWCEPQIGKRALFDTIVVVGNYAGSDLADCAPPGFTISGVTYVTQPLYALTLFLVLGPRLSIRIVYDKRRYAAATVAQLLDTYIGLLGAIAENPEQRLGSLLATAAG